MKTRQKIAVYLDYTLRVPNFKASYDAFKAELFSDKDSDLDTEDEILPGDTRFYWRQQLANPAVEQFYATSRPPVDDYAIRNVDIKSFFYNEEHYKKFVDDYSFNLYTDCKVPNQQDIDILNIAQKELFDVVLVDEYASKRKVGNTFFFLSKIRIYPQAVVFLNEGQLINEENYLAVWNPRKNTNQINAEKDKTFLNWFLELEKKSKANE